MAGNAFSVHLLRLLDYQEMAGWPAARGSEGPACTQCEAAGERIVPVPMTPSPLSPWHASLSPPSQLCPCASLHGDVVQRMLGAGRDGAVPRFGRAEKALSIL